jgi:hypothetical protein
MNSYVTAPARRHDRTTGYVTTPARLTAVPTGYVSNVNRDRIVNGYVTVPAAHTVTPGSLNDVTSERASRRFAEHTRLQSAARAA